MLIEIKNWNLFTQSNVIVLYHLYILGFFFHILYTEVTHTFLSNGHRVAFDNIFDFTEFPGNLADMICQIAKYVVINWRTSFDILVNK